jgi:hypothetical protein
MNKLDLPIVEEMNSKKDAHNKNKLNYLKFIRLLFYKKTYYCDYDSNDWNYY